MVNIDRTQIEIEIEKIISEQMCGCVSKQCISWTFGFFFDFAIGFRLYCLNSIQYWKERHFLKERLIPLMKHLYGKKRMKKQKNSCLILPETCWKKKSLLCNPHKAERRKKNRTQKSSGIRIQWRIKFKMMNKLLFLPTFFSFQRLNHELSIQDTEFFYYPFIVVLILSDNFFIVHCEWIAFSIKKKRENNFF